LLGIGPEELLERLSFFETPSGRLNVIKYLAPGGSKVSILCIHGLCCDATIFNYTSEKLANAGFNVYSVDLPGHGMSSGRKGDLDFDACLQSIGVIVSEIKKSSTKVFILAHSMGSTFALWYAHIFKDSIDGLVLLTPYIRIPGIKRSDAEPSPSAFLYLLLGRIFAPRKQVDMRKVLPGYVRIGGSQYSRMVEVDTVNFDYTFRYLIDVIARRNSRISELADIEVPVLILYGLQDRNVYPQVSEEFFKLVKSRDKKTSSLDCNHWFYDAVFYSQSLEYSDEDRGKFIDSVTKWLSSPSGKPSS
jgi:alpha-beta hydrolase superfamily lysophospholipase